jgi:hypothetical protein
MARERPFTSHPWPRSQASRVMTASAQIRRVLPSTSSRRVMGAKKSRAGIGRNHIWRLLRVVRGAPSPYGVAEEVDRPMISLALKRDLDVLGRRYGRFRYGVALAETENPPRPKPGGWEIVVVDPAGGLSSR